MTGSKPENMTPEERQERRRQMLEFSPELQNAQATYGPPNAPGPGFFTNSFMVQQSGPAMTGFMQPLPQKGTPWTCTCGAVNDWNFCTECGSRRPL